MAGPSRPRTPTTRPSACSSGSAFRGPARTTESVPDPTYGDQVQDKAIDGVSPEATVRITTQEIPGHFRDGTAYSLLAPSYELVDPASGPLAANVLVSPRIAPPVFGVGLLEAVPASTIHALADPDDTDDDGISAKANRVWDVARQELALGRFGWKANVPTVDQQNAGAFNGDIGITSSLFPNQSCTPSETACLAAPEGGIARSRRREARACHLLHPDVVGTGSSRREERRGPTGRGTVPYGRMLVVSHAHAADRRE